MIFGNTPEKEKKITQNVVMLNSYVNSIGNFSGSIYNNDVVRACIDTISRHFAKMKPEHRLKGNIVDSHLNFLLNYRPNPLMSTYDFLYKIVTNLYVNNNAYVYIQRDNFGVIKALYPIEFNRVELVKDKNNNLYIKFDFIGEKITVSVEDIIILRKHFYNNDFFGEGNNSAIYPAINLLHTINEGTTSAIKTSGILRGILNVEGMLQPEDEQYIRDSFTKDYLSIQNSGGIAITDDKRKYTPIESKPILIDNDSANSAKKKILDYFGLNENIYIGSYSDVQWQGFYESILETMAIQFSQEFTAKIFTQRQLEFKNEIIFVADRLNYLSTNSKVAIFNSLKGMGVMNKGTAAEIFNLPKPPDSEKYLQSLNYADSEIVNQYQIGESQGEIEGGELNDDSE